MALVCAVLVVPFIENALAQSIRPLKICSHSTKGRLRAKKSCRSAETQLAAADIHNISDPLPSGKTVVGVIGADYEASGGGDFGALASFPFGGGLILSDSDVIVANTDNVDNECPGATSCVDQDERSGDQQSACTGSATNPTAAPGKLCVYVRFFSASNIADLRAFPVSNLSTEPAFGFELRWDSTGVGDTLAKAVWEYTQP